MNHWCADSGGVNNTLLCLSYFTFSFVFILCTLIYTNQFNHLYNKLILILIKLITKPLLSLRFDTLSIALSYNDSDVVFL